jgi:hypothetical protein
MRKRNEGRLNNEQWDIEGVEFKKTNFFSTNGMPVCMCLIPDDLHGYGYHLLQHVLQKF